MKIRLGLIGSEDNIEQIKSVVEEHAEFDCIPFVHFFAEDVIDLLKTHQHEVDMWFFSGVYPYSIAKKWGKVNQPMFFVPYKGASLYKTLYHILYRYGINIDQLSFDGFTVSELKQIFSELNCVLQPEYLYSKINPEDNINIEEAVAHHYRLAKKGKTKAAVTCAWQVHTKLQETDVQVFRVGHANSAIESVLNMALRTYEMLRFKDRQIAVQTFEIDELISSAKDTYSSDDIYHIEIGYREKLLQYAKRIQGSFKAVGFGHYFIFTTRGILRDVTDYFSMIPDMEETNWIIEKKVTSGIGIGQSAYEAEIYARNALLNAKEHGKGSWMVVFEDKTINGPLGLPEYISYSVNSREMQAISEQTSLNVSTLSKIHAIVTKVGKAELTANDLAGYLHILPRSVRRILTQLEKKGYAKVIGEESSHPRGRPRKLYRILL